MAINHTFNTEKISTIIMDDEDTIRALRAELDMMLRALSMIQLLNSRGKTKEIHDYAQDILTAYNR